MLDTPKILTSNIQDCTSCPLHKHATMKVVGVGNWNAILMMVGEAPGGQEDEKGEPFVGAAGHLLDLLLESVNIKRKDIFITNILRCRPPSNRTPLSSEIKQCIPFLYRTMEIIKPKIIVPMGNTATHALCGTKRPISELHGTIHKGLGYRTIIPIYHPAAIIYNNKLLDIAKKDMMVIKRVLSTRA